MELYVMEGAGNRFVVLGQRLPALPEMARRLCKIYRADGLMALDTAQMRLHFYNRDGSRAAMCGNGARCICRFAYEQGLPLEIQTDAGPVTGQRLSESRYRIRLGRPAQLTKEKRGTRLVLGVPHFVIRWENLQFSQREALGPLARALRKKWDANVDLYTLLDEKTARVLTYERGVEDFTAACGTGCAAVGAVLGLPELDAQCMGGILTVENQEGDIYLTGPTRIVHRHPLPGACEKPGD